MRTRTFIGLILLVFALIVVSTPALLDLAANGIQAGAHKAGVPGIGLTAAQAAAAQSKQAGTPATDKFTPRLEVKGYVVNAKGTTQRDEFSDAERGGVQGYRLHEGGARQQLPGQLKDSNLRSNPSRVNGVLLDSTGCPKYALDEGQFVDLTDPATVTTYNTLIAAADNPGLCRTKFTAAQKASKVALANPTTTDAARRQNSATRIDQLDDGGMLIQLRELQLLQAMFGTKSTFTKQQLIAK